MSDVPSAIGSPASQHSSPPEGYAYRTAVELAKRGYKVIPIPAGFKYPKGFGKWQDIATNDLDTIKGWFEHTTHGIGLAMGRQPNGKFLFAVDVDGEPGTDKLIELLTALGGQDVFMNTANQNTGNNGAHFIFEAPFEVRNSAKQFAKHIDIRGEGGQIVVGPSIHPNGNPYVWNKLISNHPPLQAPLWVLERIKTMASDEKPRATMPVSTLVRVPRETDSPLEWANENLGVEDMLTAAGWQYSHNAGRDQLWVRPGKAIRDGHSASLHDDGTLVVFTTEAPREFEQLAKPGAAGTLVMTPFDVFCATQHGGDVREAMSHIRRNLMPRTPAARTTGQGVDETTGAEDEAGVRVPAPTNLPDEFWESRPWLAMVRQAAHSRLMSADAVLGALISRYATIIPPTYKIPAMVGSHSTFDHLSILAGHSSSGKSAAMAIARELFPGPLERKDIVWDWPTPTGEGLVSAFFEMVADEDNKKSSTNTKTKTAVLFLVDEAMAIIQASSRQSATIGSVLCAAWSGNDPGQGNASADRKRVGMNPFTFRMAGLAAIQLSLGHHLLDDRFVEQGLSGRLVFFAAEDPSIPDPDDTIIDWPGALDLPIHPTVNLVVDYAPEINAEVRREHYKRTVGKTREAPVDGHLRLVRLKLSGILTLMDGRRSVTQDDWALAGMIVDSHKALRAVMLEHKVEAARVKNAASATAAAHFEITRDEIKERQKVARLADSIIRQTPEEGIGRGALSRRVTSKETRHRFEEALQQAVDRGAVQSDEERVWPA